MTCRVAIAEHYFPVDLGALLDVTRQRAKEKEKSEEMITERVLGAFSPYAPAEQGGLTGPCPSPKHNKFF
jgi:hypothetical protein